MRRCRQQLRPCHAAGCPAQVTRGQLMCRTHWSALPAALRGAINGSRAGHMAESYRANIAEARAFLERAAATASERAYAATARLLGEREDE